MPENAVDEFSIEQTKAFIHIMKGDCVAALRSWCQANDVNKAFPNGDTPLTWLFNHKHDGGLKHMRILLQAGADPNKECSFGIPPILHAAFLDRPSWIKTLLDNGANIDAVDERGLTALMQACMHAAQADVQAARLLLGHGADPNISDPSGMTALFYACRNMHQGEETIGLLLEHGSNPNARDCAGGTPLMCAARLSSLQSEKGLDLLRQHGAQINAQDHHGWSALMLACANDSRGTVNWLLKQGVDLELQAHSMSSSMTIDSPLCGAPVQNLTLPATALDIARDLGMDVLASILSAHLARKAAQEAMQDLAITSTASTRMAIP